MLKLQKAKYICKSKGVGKFMKEKDDFIRILSTGVVDMERFTKMKESNNIGIKSGSIMNFSKHLSFNDEKRNWHDKDFRINDWQDSEPLKLIEGMTPMERRKVTQAYDRQQEKAQQKYFESDLFDKHAVGSDISAKEFFDNERWFEREE